MPATALFEMRGKTTVKKKTLWKEKKDFFYVEKSRSFCAKSQRTETEKCWAGLHTPSRALHSLLVPPASGSGDKTRERGERRRGDGSRVKERRGEGKVGRGEWRKGQEIRGRWRSRKGGGEEVRSSRKIKYIPKHIFFYEKENWNQETCCCSPNFSLCNKHFKYNSYAFLCCMGYFKGATYPASPETPISFNDLFPHNRSSSLQKIEDKQIQEIHLLSISNNSQAFKIWGQKKWKIFRIVSFTKAIVKT